MTNRHAPLAAFALAVALAGATQPGVPPEPSGSPAQHIAPTVDLHVGATPTPAPAPRRGVLGAAIRVGGMVQRLSDPRKTTRWSLNHGQVQFSVRTP